MITIQSPDNSVEVVHVSATVPRDTALLILHRIAEELDKVGLIASRMACEESADPRILDLSLKIAALAAGVRKI